MEPKTHTFDVQINIDDNHKLTLTTPDGLSSSKQYPMSWSEQDIMDDCCKLLNGLRSKIILKAKVKEVVPINGA